MQLKRNEEVCLQQEFIFKEKITACSSLMQNLRTTHSSVHIIISQFKLRKQWCIQYTFIEIKNIHPKTYM